MFSKINSAGLFGLNAFPVVAEASASAGQPSFDIVGMPDVAVQESKARIRAVLGQLNLALPGGKVTVNLAPASVRKTGAMFDLPITMALLELIGVIQTKTDDAAFIGELSLDGTLAPVNGVLSPPRMQRRRPLPRALRSTARSILLRLSTICVCGK